MENSSYVQSQVLTEKDFLKRTFLIAGTGFLAIFLIALATSYFIDSTGILRDELNSTKRFNFEMYRNIQFTGAVSRLARVSAFSGGLIFISWILMFIWVFRIFKASKPFIYITFSVYVLAQGLGFGTLFATWKAIDLIGIFAAGAIIFMTMAFYGYTTKHNLLAWSKWITVGIITAMVLFMINFILYYAGIYNQPTSLAVIALFGIITIALIAYEVHLVRKTSQYANAIGGFDEMTNFRLTMWFGFRLLITFIMLLRILILLYARRR